MAARARTRGLRIVLIVALLGIVGWSVVWFVAATVVDRQIDRVEQAAARSGNALSCGERIVTGYPFRIEVRCGEGTGADLGPRGLALDGLRVAAQVYDPGHVIVEADGPAAARFGGVAPVIVDWTLAHASAHLSIGDSQLDRLTAEVTDVTVRLGGLEMAAAEMDLSLRRDPDDPRDVGLYVRLADVVPHEGMAAATLALRGRIAGAAPLLEGRPEEVVARFLSEGVSVAIEEATFEADELLLAATGNLALGPDGLLDGKVDVAVAGHEAPVPYLEVMDPQAETLVSSLITNFLTHAPATMIGDREARAISVTIDEGRIKPGGLLTVGRLPPIALGR